MSKRSYIFLDVDGVLNHQGWYRQAKQNKMEKLASEKYQKYKGSKIPYELRLECDVCDFDPAKVELINGLVDRTGAKVVISSSWRKSRSVEQLQELFERVGFKHKVYDKTPTLHFAQNKQNYSYSVPRGCEIKAWLELNKGTHNERMTNIPYVIFDDDSDMLFWQRENFFRCDTSVGITPNVIYRAEQFLKKLGVGTK